MSTEPAAGQLPEAHRFDATFVDGQLVGVMTPASYKLVKPGEVDSLIYRARFEILMDMQCGQGVR